MSEMQNPYEALMIKASQEAAFRDSLLKDPKGTLETFLGARLPEDLAINVVENTATELTLVIPPLKTDELSEEALSAVAGGYQVQAPPDERYDTMFSVFTAGIGCLVSALRGGIHLCR